MKKAIHKKSFAYLLLTIVSIGLACAQTTVHVITKTFDGEEAWTEGVRLELNSENAEIHCEAYPGKTIRYEVQFIAKHPEKESAEADLKKMKWISGKQGKTVFMRNYIELSPDDLRPESNLKAVYRIKIPIACPLTINNYFGEISVKNIHSTLIIKSEFATITLNNISGNIEVVSKLRDISGTALNGNIEIISNRSNIDFSDISGSIDIDASVAKIALEQIYDLIRLNITAKKSEISLACGNHYRYLLGLEKADFEKPDWMKMDAPQKNETAQKSNFIAHPEYPVIDIKLTVGTFQIK